MPSDTDTNYIAGEIDRLAYCGDADALAKIARSLLAELADLRESPQVTLEPGEEWPLLDALAPEESGPFSVWRDYTKKPCPNDSDALYFPWHLAEWRASQAQISVTGTPEPSDFTQPTP